MPLIIINNVHYIWKQAQDIIKSKTTVDRALYSAIDVTEQRKTHEGNRYCLSKKASKYYLYATTVHLGNPLIL